MITNLYKSGYFGVELHRPLSVACTQLSYPVTARKDDAPAVVQAAIVNLAGVESIAAGGGLIQTTSG